MSVVSASKVAYEPLRSLAFGSIGAAYVQVGDATSNPIRSIKIQNFTDQNLLISYDGTTDHDAIAASGYFVWDYSSNKSNQGGFFEQAQGTKFYVKQESAGPTLGNVYITVIYASQV